MILPGFFATQIVKSGHATSGQSFHFAVLSGTPVGSSQATASEIVILSGAGTFSAADARVQATGSFTLFDNTTPVPHVIIDQGTWHAIGFVSFAPTTPSSYGQVTPGILTITTEFQSTSGAETTVTMKIVCNAPPGGLFTGSPEGVTVVLGGNTFAPTSPGLGITLIELASN